MINNDVVVNIGDLKIYDNDFELTMDEACQKFKIDDLVKEGQSRWKAVMFYVGKRIFPDNKILKNKSIVYLDGNKIPTNNNKFDYNILNILCDYYIQLSRQYNKLISAVAFSAFVNIPVNTIDQWKQAEPDTMSYKIWKKLQDDREDSLKDKAADNGNVMGLFQIGRREFGWDMPNVRTENKIVPPKNPREIAAMYGINLPNSEKDELKEQN